MKICINLAGERRTPDKPELARGPPDLMSYEPSSPEEACQLEHSSSTLAPQRKSAMMYLETTMGAAHATIGSTSRPVQPTIGRAITHPPVTTLFMMLRSLSVLLLLHVAAAASTLPPPTTHSIIRVPFVLSMRGGEGEEGNLDPSESTSEARVNHSSASIIPVGGASSSSSYSSQLEAVKAMVWKAASESVRGKRRRRPLFFPVSSSPVTLTHNHLFSPFHLAFASLLPQLILHHTFLRLKG
jgi:hypothetical protein